MTHSRTELFVNLDTLSKICIFILLGKTHTYATSAKSSDLQHGKNGSVFHCPSFSKIHLRWHEFHPFTHYNSSGKTLEGDLPRFMQNAFNICCPNLQMHNERVNISSSCEMEILIRQNHDDNAVVHFPIFSNRGEKEQFERRFIALFHSPGPAVLKFVRGLGSFSAGFLYVLKNWWKLILISLLHAILAGMIIWALVCILTKTSLLFIIFFFFFKIKN